MKKMNLVLFLMFTLVGAKAQEAVQLSDLVGKWKLTKVEEEEMQGDLCRRYGLLFLNTQEQFLLKILSALLTAV